MQVLKRDNTYESFIPQKIFDRLYRLCNKDKIIQKTKKFSVFTEESVNKESNDKICAEDDIDSVNDVKNNTKRDKHRACTGNLSPLYHVDVDSLVTKITSQICNGITTHEIDNLSSEVCASLSSLHYEYGTLAGRIVTSNLHKQTKFGSFSKKIKFLYYEGVIAEDVYHSVCMNHEILDNAIEYDRDYDISFFGIKTLIKSYLIKRDILVDSENNLILDQKTSDSGFMTENAKNQINADTVNYDVIKSNEDHSETNNENLNQNIQRIKKRLVEDSSSEEHDLNACSPIKKTKEVAKNLIETSTTQNKKTDNIANYKLVKQVLLERPQDMFMRVALGIHCNDIPNVLLTYYLLSKKFLIHATPTLFNAGTVKPQMSSCFLLDIQSDSIDGIYNTLKQCALISKNSGGIGLSVSKIRSTGSNIGISGTSNGITPMLRVFNSTARYVDQGGNKRPGSIAVFLEPWHSDIFEFLDLRKNTGKDEIRCRDLFLGLWVPNLFMECVRNDEDWHLFCPNDCYIQKDVLKILIELHDQFNGDFNLINTKLNSKNFYLKEKIDQSKKSNEAFISKNKDKIVNKNIISVKKSQYNNEKNIIGLHEVYGKEFDVFYKKLVHEGKFRRKIKAQHLWKYIIEAQIETGNPYILYKDQCNIRNNQKKEGSLKGSNLCTEILQYTNENEVAVCNLGSIALPKFIKKIRKNCESPSISKNNHNINTISNLSSSENFLNVDQFIELSNYRHTKQEIELYHKRCSNTNDYSNQITVNNIFKDINNEELYIDYDLIAKIAETLTLNLNKVIDRNFYPIEEAERSNQKHRPIGIGVQGLADVFFILRIPFESKEARIINKRIFECIYYGALVGSNKLAKKYGTYKTYEGSPLSKGILQFDYFLENHEKLIEKNSEDKSEYFNYSKGDYSLILDSYLNLNWPALRENIKKYGCRNSLLVAPMPTASTSQILGYNECFEPNTSNIYTRRTLAGEFQVVNQYLMQDLLKLNQWNFDMKNYLIETEGSIQQINLNPSKSSVSLKDLYKNVWEMKMKNIIDIAADRQMFIDQSQSLNLFVAEPSYTKLTSMHFYAFSRGLKTGMYYLRTKPVACAIKFTVDKENLRKFVSNEQDDSKNTENDESGCASCSA
ncbi:ribonucleoside-diphosphate reductase, alpha subunit [Edhazardia aedis USNM 41457]|uniref:Ribonucleoside-diphosphate reductase n=1 Tax=Edhazardia aedis (strain USNM 41457) TaxID=1003232 RepID=J9D0F4_EDHAE|nr:ribonucleoside-diphosphate reductase, alpha subunit [Edhazardia aedis USNM 41457]|eukprot:EJW01366.1 ribonucleoside-diphosphate reductase, alpha subunit [Edhazardia aedis USNM 41457]